MHVDCIIIIFIFWSISYKINNGTRAFYDVLAIISVTRSNPFSPCGFFFVHMLCFLDQKADKKHTYPDQDQSSMLKVICNQRDRFRARLRETEEVYCSRFCNYSSFTSFSSIIAIECIQYWDYGFVGGTNEFSKFLGSKAVERKDRRPNSRIGKNKSW